MTSARLQAELYALTHRGNAGDVEFYTNFCESASSVLELGCGYGRLLRALAQRGRRVLGLDSNRELLALAKRSLRALPESKQRGVSVLNADMSRFGLAVSFERVLLPYNGLFCLLGRRAALACFRAVRAALTQNGLFVFDVWNAEGFHRERAAVSGADANEPIVTIQYAGRVWDVFERSRTRRHAQRVDVTYDYLPRTGGKPCQIVIPQRYYLERELSELLAQAGLAVRHRFGDFSGARFSRRAEHLIVVAGPDRAAQRALGKQAKIGGSGSA
jgi:SAM-dependent methyltransferase